jgi:hypothetical protein
MVYKLIISLLKEHFQTVLITLDYNFHSTQAHFNKHPCSSQLSITVMKYETNNLKRRKVYFSTKFRSFSP